VTALPLCKYHGLGNDYVVVDAVRDPAWATGLDAAAIRRLCDRHRGVGADGILLRHGDDAGLALRIFNPDGSEAEKSGNGLRIFARYLWDRGVVDHAPFVVGTPGGRVRCRVLAGGAAVRVEMGRVSFDSEAIPVRGPRREVLREPVEVAGERLEMSAATIGNPHCVVLREAPTEADARRLGPLLETAPRFPQRTNVQLLEVRDRTSLRIEIWERGAGYTLASGSSSCAAAAVARRLGLCDALVAVHMPGGSLRISVGEDFAVEMEGPVEAVWEGQVRDASMSRALPTRS